MKVAVIGARGIPNVEGGAEKNAEQLFPLVAERHDVTLYAIRSYTTVPSYRNIRIVTSPLFRLFGTEKLPCYIYATLRSFWERPDIIHCQGLGSAVFLALYKLAARRVVVRYGSIDYKMAKWSPIGRFGFWISEWQLRFADAVIAVTPALKESLVSRGFRVRIEVIPNALDPIEGISGNADKVMAEHGLVDGSFVLGIGRLTAQKDFATLIRAFQMSRARGECRFGKLVIVGGDDGSGYHQELLAEAGDDVIFTGRLPRPEVQALLTRCGAYVNSSVHEGMSNAVLEAVSAGCPVLLSDIVENRDLPVGAHHFFRTGDAAALSGALYEASRRPADFVVSQAPFITWDQVGARTLALYDSLFERRGAAGSAPKRETESPAASDDSNPAVKI